MRDGGEPSAVEVLAWMARTGRTAADAADHFWGDVTGDERLRLRARIRQWATRARKTGAAAAPPPASYGPPPQRAAPAPAPLPAPALPPAPPPPRPPAPTPELGRVEWLRAQLAQLLYDSEQERSRGDLRLVPTLDRRLSEVRAELDDELSKTRGAVNIERTPGAILAEVDRRATALALRREMAQRKAARAEAVATREAGADGEEVA